jgi:hypothetical protein
LVRKAEGHTRKAKDALSLSLSLSLEWGRGQIERETKKDTHLRRSPRLPSCPRPWRSCFLRRRTRNDSCCRCSAVAFFSRACSFLAGALPAATALLRANRRGEATRAGAEEEARGGASNERTSFAQQEDGGGIGNGAEEEGRSIFRFRGASFSCATRRANPLARLRDAVGIEGSNLCSL